MSIEPTCRHHVKGAACGYPECRRIAELQDEIARLREDAERLDDEGALADLKIKMTGNSRDYEVLLAERDAEIARLREDAEAAARAAWDAQAAAGATAVAAGATAGAAWAARAAAWAAARKDFNKLIRDTK